MRKGLLLQKPVRGPQKSELLQENIQIKYKKVSQQKRCSKMLRYSQKCEMVNLQLSQIFLFCGR